MVDSISLRTAVPPKLDTLATLPAPDSAGKGAVGRYDDFVLYDGAKATIESVDAAWGAGDFAKVARSIAAFVKTIDIGSVSSLSADDSAKLTRTTYLLQQRLVGATNKLSMVTNAADKKAALTTLEQLGKIQTELFERVVTIADSNDPAPVTAWQVFRNTKKKQGHHGRAVQEAYFLEKLEKFIGKGGNVQDIRTLDASGLADLEHDRSYEFVVDAYDKARFAPTDLEPSPGHTLLAWGGDALCAGSFRVYRDSSGDIAQVILGTFSGHFRSPAEYNTHLARHFVALGVDPEKIIIQGGEAGTPRGLELLATELGLDGAEAQREMAALKADAARFNPQADPATFTKGEAKARGDRGKPFPAEKLNHAVFAMQQTARDVLANGVVLESRGEASKMAAAVREAYSLAREAGNFKVVDDAVALLSYLATLDAPHIDGKGKEIIAATLADVEKQARNPAADVADILSQRPASGRRARVIATLDPGVSEAKLQEMMAAGMDVARLNSAHGTLKAQKACIARVRKVAAELGKPISIQLDLAGPKIRLGHFENPKNLEYNDIWLTTGESVTLTNAAVKGTSKLLPIALLSLGDDVVVGDRVFMNDGLVQLEVMKSSKDAKGNAVLEAKVLRGDKVWDRKGVNLPDSKLSVSTITPADIKALETHINDIDVVAQSFTATGSDVEELAQRMRKLGRVLPIFAKIERRSAVDNLEEIAAFADGLMVARGDLGVEIGFSKVPAVERRINELGNRLGIPTIVATEAMMSMVDGSARPSRGEAEGLFSAIYEQGADAVMLGKETSFGKDPGNVISVASALIEEAENERRHLPYKNAIHSAESLQALADAIAGIGQVPRSIA